MAQQATISGSGAGTTARRVSGVSGVWALWLQRLANWRRRRQVAGIEHLDDHLLDDIGLTRSDVRRAGSMPLDQDPIAVLKLAAERNRVARRQNSGPPAEVALSLAALRTGQCDDGRCAG